MARAFRHCRRLTGDQARALEPNVPSVSGLLSPNTGIVGAHALMDALLQQARTGGALLQPRSELIGLEHLGEGYRLTVRSGTEVESFTRIVEFSASSARAG